VIFAVNKSKEKEGLSWMWYDASDEERGL